MSEFATFVGIDWSDKKHDVCLVDAATGRKEFSIIKQSPEAINDWALQLRTRFAGQKVAVCLEQSRGPLIFALLKYDFLMLFPIHPIAALLKRLTNENTSQKTCYFTSL